MTTAIVVAVLGAESTGKTTIARGLAEAFANQGRRVALVGEFLREFCDRVGRTPRRDEQQFIADEQSGRISDARRSHDVVIADTTALMTAVYSDWVFGDAGLYRHAEAVHASYDLSLLTSLDLPWQADGLQRDGPQVREPVDALVRASLLRVGSGYSVVAGAGPARLAAAIACVSRALAPPVDDAPTARWHWHCERCGDAGCERSSLFRSG